VDKVFKERNYYIYYGNMSWMWK